MIIIKSLSPTPRDEHNIIIVLYAHPATKTTIIINFIVVIAVDVIVVVIITVIVIV